MHPHPANSHFESRSSKFPVQCISIFSFLTQLQCCLMPFVMLYSGWDKIFLSEAITISSSFHLFVPMADFSALRDLHTIIQNVSSESISRFLSNCSKCINCGLKVDERSMYYNSKEILTGGSRNRNVNFSWNVLLVNNLYSTALCHTIYFVAVFAWFFHLLFLLMR